MGIKKIFPQKIKNVYHLFQAITANFYYGFPSRKIKIIGVTGTNGKTTTVQMIAKILEEARKKVALASTINFQIGKKSWVNKTKFTTLSAFQVQQFIRKAVKKHCQYLILETSSHSLDQNRAGGVKYDIAVITNVTREHLDYHKTMDRYRRAKLKLFNQAKTAVINLEMERPKEFILNSESNVYGYSTKLPTSNFQFSIKHQFPASNFKTVVAKNIQLENSYSKFRIQNSEFQLNIPGKFNIENALAAISVGLAEKINLETSARSLKKIKGIPGRMEYVQNNKELNIIIDYAVTPDSLEKLYELINKIGKKSKIIAVFGACGERDRGKRPLMGKIVSRWADYVMVTNEDPYNEDPQRIIDEVFSGVVKNQKAKIENENCWRILDRREAIKKALQIANPGDFVVVTGKGAEETMAVGNKRIPWNDKKVIQAILQEARLK